MPMIQVGASLPDGKQIQQSRKFKYSLWSFRLKQYDLSERMLKTAMFQMHLHVRYCYHAALLIRDSWELLRSAFAYKTQTLYDKRFDELVAFADAEFRDYLELNARSYPYSANSSPSEELEKRIRGANRHLKYLSDRSGFGNKLLKTYESGDYEGTNVLG